MFPRLVIVSLGLALVAAGSSRPTYRQQREALDRRLEAQQAKTPVDPDLDPEAGLPDVLLDGTPPTIAPGQSKKVTAQCNLPKDATILSVRDDVAIVSSKHDGKRCEVVVRADDDAWPGPITLEAVMPVTGRADRFDAGTVKARYAITAALENGWTARVKVPGALGEEQVEGEARWFKPGADKPFRTTAVWVSGTPVAIAIAVVADDDRMDAASDDTEKVLAAATPTAAEQKVIDTANRKLEACLKKLPEEVEACAAKPTREVTAVYEAIRARSEEAMASTASGKVRREFGCDDVAIERTEDGLGGIAHGCEAQEEMRVRSAKVEVVR